jgi:hypothetical protein
MTSFDRERWRGRWHIAGRVGMLLLFVAFMFGPLVWRAAHALGWL